MVKNGLEITVPMTREMLEKNALTWPAMICGLENHGHRSKAIRVFQRMMEIGLQLDKIPI
ncbi:hypothetical protein IEQ34_012715 [Dendrobium chrysotoxum]|uniref:Pentatricopeptide repeat-containing protein n=1 Tax=Dendrobium chrysotoxum TaxID=161865 RepID=A0AAV7GPI5_DENCH|nr:hypothetical protein IEQ34_012715 [Dendrobium chrysotoxum]